MSKTRKNYWSLLTLVATTAVIMIVSSLTVMFGTYPTSAEVTEPASGFAMTEGASIRKTGDVGIRFTSNVTQDWYNSVTQGGAVVEFGTLITNTPTDGSEITINSANVVAIPCTATPKFDSGTFSYSGSVTYSDLTETQLLLAPIVQLTGRGYAKVTSTVGEEATEKVQYFYAESNDNSRSMNQVATRAIEAGETIQNAEDYTRLGEVAYDNTLGFIEESKENYTVSVTGDFGENVKAYIGTNEVDATYENGSLTIDKTALPAGLTLGKDYSLTLVNAAQNMAFSQRVLFVTKAIRTADDLDVFDITMAKVREAFTKDDGVTSGEVDMSADGNNTYYVDGYYYLANDIDASEKVIKQSGLTLSETIDGVTLNYRNNGDTYYVGNQSDYIGFRGVFEGAGHTISGLTLGRAGLFGNLCAGSNVLNVAFTDVKLTAQDADKGSIRGGNVLACHIKSKNANKTTIENIYIQLASNQLTRGILAYDYRSGGTLFTINNVIIDCPDLTTRTENTYGSFISDINYIESDNDYTLGVLNSKSIKNVHVISNVDISKVGTYDNGAAVTVYALYGANEEAPTYVAKGGGDAPTFQLTGVTRYATREELAAATGIDYSSFTDSGYWTLGADGVPVFGRN